MNHPIIEVNKNTCQIFENFSEASTNLCVDKMGLKPNEIPYNRILSPQHALSSRLEATYIILDFNIIFFSSYFLFLREKKPLFYWYKAGRGGKFYIFLSSPLKIFVLDKNCSTTDGRMPDERQWLYFVYAR